MSVGAMVTAVLLTGSAQAQMIAVPAPAPPIPPMPTSDADSPLTLGAPLRLSLARTTDIPFARAAPNCMTEAETSGNALHGLAATRALGYRWTPHLSIIGFSSLGCPFDAGVGGGFVYAVPLSPKFSFIASAGAYVLPQVVERGWLLKTDARLDVQWKIEADRTMQLGVDALRTLQTTGRKSSRTRGVSLGGTF